jgi:photosystem II stability/assembly factor-like uncharacterized protein
VGTGAPDASNLTPVTVIVATSNGGLTWAAQRPPLATTPQLSGISCPVTGNCMAVGSTASVSGPGLVLTTRNGGLRWDQATIPSGAFALTAVECSNVHDCRAIFNNGIGDILARTTDFGRTWQSEGTLPAGFQNARDLSCRHGVCLVAGDTPTSTGHAQGAIAFSGDGGLTWMAAKVPTGIGVLQGSVCATQPRCLAAGTTSTTVSDVVPAKGELLQSRDGGRSWALSPSIPPVNDVFGIACPLAQVCAMVGTNWVGHPSLGTGAVALSGNGGKVFAAASAAYVPLSLTALSCPTDLGCVAVGGDVLARVTLPAISPKDHATRRTLTR